MATPIRSIKFWLARKLGVVPEVKVNPPILLDEQDTEYQVTEAFLDQWVIRPLSWIPPGAKESIAVPTGSVSENALGLVHPKVEPLQRSWQAGREYERRIHSHQAEAFISRTRHADMALARGEDDSAEQNRKWVTRHV